MARSRPALLTAVLSAAAVVGYLSYRALAPSAPADDSSAKERAADAAAALAASVNDGEDEAEPELADRLPEFSLGNLAGETQSIASWPGKPMLINFWATWCGPCLKEIPLLKAQQAATPDLQIVGIAIDKRDAVVSFAAKMQFNYPILIGENDGWEAAAKFGVNVYAMPFTVFTSPDGSVLGVHTGELHKEHLENLTATLADLRDGKIDLAGARARIAGRI